MNFKNILFRLVAVLTAFILGVAFFNAAQYLQTFFRTPESAALPSAVKKENLFVPPRSAPTVIFDAPQTVAESEEEIGCEYDGYGDYLIEGDLPRGFKGFDRINIVTRNFKAKSKDCPIGTPIPPQGHLQTTKEYKFARISIGNKQITFETETINRISYKFAGRFEPGKAEGLLIKIRGGKIAAESQVRFLLDEKGGC